MTLENQRQGNREKLLHQGVALLTQQGYHGTGLKEILDAVQIPKGSFYNYFGSKENFAAEVITHYINPFIEQVQLHLHQYDDALTGLQAYFELLINELEKNQFKGGCLLGNLLGEIGDSSLCKEALQTAVWRYRDVLQIGLLKAQQQGSVRVDKSAQEMADLLVNAWQGALLRMKIEQSTAPLKQCRDDLLNDFFKQ